MARKHPDNHYPSVPARKTPYATHHRCGTHGYIPHEECPDSNIGFLCPICLGLPIPKQTRVSTTPQWRKLKRNYLPAEPREVPLTDEEVMQLVSMG